MSNQKIPFLTPQTTNENKFPFLFHTFQRFTINYYNVNNYLQNIHELIPLQPGQYQKSTMCSLPPLHSSKKRYFFVCPTVTTLYNLASLLLTRSHYTLPFAKLRLSFSATNPSQIEQSQLYRNIVFLLFLCPKFCKPQIPEPQ